MSTHTLDEMPDWLDRRHADLNEAARRFYGARDAAGDAGDPIYAAELQAAGDGYFLKAIALTEEWC